MRLHSMCVLNVLLTETELYQNSKVHVTDGKGPSLGVAYIFGYKYIVYINL